MDWIEELLFTDDDLLVLGFHTVRMSGYLIVLPTVQEVVKSVLK